MAAESTQRLVGISISTPPDLAELGFGEEHMHELMIAIARMLLRLGELGEPVHLAYGGDLRPGGFTETMLDLALAESVIAQNREQQDAKQAQKQTHGRIFSYLAWPYYADLTTSYEAQHLNVCSFIRVTPRSSGLDSKKYPDTITQGDLPADDVQYLKAICISHLRELISQGNASTFDDATPPLAASVILGGKISRYSGVMPGIFEEFMHAVRARIPVFIIGGFGGAAKALADTVLLGGLMLPEIFTLRGQSDHKDNPDLKELQRIFEERNVEPTIEQRYQDLQDALISYAEDLNQAESSRATNGLSRSDNERLMGSRNIVEITGLIECGLRTRWQRSG